MSLFEKINKTAEDSISEAQKKAERETNIAKAWDATGFNRVEPWIIYTHGSYGDVGGLGFRSVGPDELVALMRAFPAIPRTQYRENGTSYWHPHGARDGESAAAHDAKEGDGYELRMGGYGHQQTAEMEWSSMVGALQISLKAELRVVHALHPHAWRRWEQMRKDLGRYVGAAEMRWPESFPMPRGLWTISYATGSDQSIGDIRVRGVGLLALAESWESECNRRGNETRSAFLKDWEKVEALPMPNADDITKSAEEYHTAYDAESMRAGTLEQYAALRTPRAKAEHEAAKKNWSAYADHHNMQKDYKGGHGYFDHYTWACDFLKRCGLYEAPVTEEMRARATGGIPAETTTYKYGHRWL